LVPVALVADYRLLVQAEAHRYFQQLLPTAAVAAVVLTQIQAKTGLLVVLAAEVLEI